MKKNPTHSEIYKATGLKFHTIDETFAQSEKSREFRDAYREELLLAQMAREFRVARRAKRMTQEGLAKKAHMPQSTIARLESGKNGTSATTLLRVIDAMGKQFQIS